MLLSVAGVCLTTIAIEPRSPGDGDRPIARTHDRAHTNVRMGSVVARGKTSLISCIKHGTFSVRSQTTLSMLRDGRGKNSATRIIVVIGEATGFQSR